MVTRKEFGSAVKMATKEAMYYNPSWRYGQAIFNVVDRNYNVARIAQFDYGIDCFYDDTMVEKFLDKCYELINTVKND